MNRQAVAKRMYDGPTRIAMNGDELLSSPEYEARFGHAVAVDADGYEYVRGIDESAQLKGEKGSIARSMSGHREIWYRTPAGEYVREDTTVAPDYSDGLERTSERAPFFGWLREITDDWRNSAAVLHGRPGSGKTRGGHTALKLASRHGVNVRAVKWRDVAALYADHFKSEELTRAWLDLEAEIAGVPVLMLDDIGAERPGERPTPGSQATLLSTLDAREFRSLPTIITTNMSLQEMRAAGWDERACSRLSAFRWLTMGGKDWRPRTRDA